MPNEAVGFAGTLLLLTLCFSCTVMCSKALIRAFQTGDTFDRQLGRVSKGDNPNLFGLHVLGFGLLILISVFAQIGLIVATFRHLFFPG